jgi:hypothetical protein
MSHGKVFISYRRTDSAHAAGRLYDRLETWFGKDRVFMDVEHLEPGINFIATIDKAVGECSVLIALIGPQWLTVRDDKGERRLDDDSACNSTDTEQVGSYSPNGYEIYDLAANVCEWVADWYDADYYVNSPSDHPQGPNSGDKRVVRSGSWVYLGYNLRVSNCFSSYPENRHSDLGFHCARDVRP